MYSKDYYDSAEYNPEVIGIKIFQKMSQYMPYMVFITKAPDFKLLYANRKVSEFLGFNLDDLHEMDGHIWRMMEVEDRNKLMDMALKIQYINDDQALKLNVKLKTKEGRYVDLETSVSVFKRDADGMPAEYICVSEDITERVQLEIRTRELEVLARSAEETFRYGAWEWFPDEDVVIWSKGIHDIFEKSIVSNHFTNNDYRQMIHADDRDRFEKAISEACRTASDFTVEYRITSPSNNVSYLREQGRPIVDEQGKILKFIGTIRDVSDYWETLNNLHKYEVTLQQAEKQLNLGTWEWNVSKRLVKWSDGFWDLLEYPPELRHSSWMPIEHYFQHVPDEEGDSSINNMFEIQNSGESQSLEPLEVTMNTYLGKTVHAITHIRILEWKDGKPGIAVGSTANLTSMKNIQKNLEAKIIELAKAYEEVEQFSYVASHDLQEPLRKISAFSARLKEKCGNEMLPDCALYLERIIDGTERMRVLIENLLALSRTKRKTEHFKPTDLNEILNDVVTDLENKMTAKSARIEYPKLPVIEAIPTQMHQLFLNLLTNSIKFTKEDTKPVVDITFSYLTEKQKNGYSLDKEQDYLFIQIKDNGIGFEPAYAETIFSPFKRLHGRSEYEGTGIGLAICKKVVQNHQGIIWASSTPGEGANFHIVLALSQPGGALN